VIIPHTFPLREVRCPSEGVLFALGRPGSKNNDAQNMKTSRRLASHIRPKIALRAARCHDWVAGGPQSPIFRIGNFFLKGEQP